MLLVQTNPIDPVAQSRYYSPFIDKSVTQRYDSFTKILKLVGSSAVCALLMFIYVYSNKHGFYFSINSILNFFGYNNYTNCYTEYYLFDSYKNKWLFVYELDGIRYFKSAEVINNIFNNQESIYSLNSNSHNVVTPRADPRSFIDTSNITDVSTECSEDGDDRFTDE